MRDHILNALGQDRNGMPQRALMERIHDNVSTVVGSPERVEIRALVNPKTLAKELRAMVKEGVVVRDIRRSYHGTNGNFQTKAAFFSLAGE